MCTKMWVIASLDLSSSHWPRALQPFSAKHLKRFVIVSLSLLPPLALRPGLPGLCTPTAPLSMLFVQIDDAPGWLSNQLPLVSFSSPIVLSLGSGNPRILAWDGLSFHQLSLDEHSHPTASAIIPDFSIQCILLSGAFLYDCLLNVISVFSKAPQLRMAPLLPVKTNKQKNHKHHPQFFSFNHLL